MPANHSSSVGSTSRTNACRWRTRASLISRTLGEVAFAIRATTASVIVSSVVCIAPP